MDAEQVTVSRILNRDLIFLSPNGQVTDARQIFCHFVCYLAGELAAGEAGSQSKYVLVPRWSPKVPTFYRGAIGSWVGK